MAFPGGYLNLLFVYPDYMISICKALGMRPTAGLHRGYKYPCSIPTSQSKPEPHLRVFPESYCPWSWLNIFTFADIPPEINRYVSENLTRLSNTNDSTTWCLPHGHLR